MKISLKENIYKVSNSLVTFLVYFLLFRTTCVPPSPAEFDEIVDFVEIKASQASMATDRKPKKSPNTTISMASNSWEIVTSNDDLLKEILIKLPLKSLVKFTSVSKHWLSLISSPEFSHRRTPSSVSGLFLDALSSYSVRVFPKYDFVDLNQTSNPTNPPFRSLIFNDDATGLRIGHSCNGLLLCYFPPLTGPSKYYVYNPTTRKYTLLPPLPLPSRSDWGLSLAFDPSNSRHYKVVFVFKADAIGEHYRIGIYSSETGTWRLAGDSLYAIDSTTPYYGDVVYWNGAVHWFRLDAPSVYFNVDQERLSEMPLPPAIKDWVDDKEFRYVGESHGHLHIIYNAYSPTETQLDVYEMEMDYSGWFLKFRVDLSVFLFRFPEIIASQFYHHPGGQDYLFSVVYIVRGDVDEESYAVIRIPGKVVRYNFKSKAFCKLCDNEAARGDERFYQVLDNFEAYPYIESLALV